LPAVDADQLFNLPQASLWTIRFGNYYAVSKSMGKWVNAKASHILISYEGTKVPNKKNNELKKKRK
jgi:peptidyl-prolyl cis-trans isomerase D